VANERRPKLDRDVFVNAAIRIASRREPDGLTTRVLGAELGVDRTAVWRHFTDKDALLRAVGDRLLEMATERVDLTADPRTRLRQLANATADIFTAHPHVASELSLLGTSGPGELASIEIMLAALTEIGLAKPAAALLQRTMADTVLALLSAHATHSLLREHADEDNAVWVAGFRAINPNRYPSVSAHADELARIEFSDIFEALFASFMTSVSGFANRDSETAPQ